MSRTDKIILAILVWLALGLSVTAFGAVWMAHEQRRANEGIFVPFPSPGTYHVQPKGE